MDSALLRDKSSSRTSSGNGAIVRTARYVAAVMTTRPVRDPTRGLWLLVKRRSKTGPSQAARTIGESTIDRYTQTAAAGSHDHDIHRDVTRGRVMCLRPDRARSGCRGPHGTIGGAPC